MTVTATSIKDMFPEFSTKTDSFIDIYIDNSKLMICSDFFGNRYDMALSYLTAHYLKTSLDNGKEVVSEKVDALSRNYKSSSGENGYLSTTYGREFLNIKSSISKHRMRPIVGSRIIF